MATDDGGLDLGVGKDGGEVDVRALVAEVERLRARQDQIKARQDQLLHRLSMIGGFVAAELDGLRVD